ncbi:hypothetical protein JCM33374_g5139 [Metschnikowia sp. JCM 33374]|nr:hypothetical protein JCM33374_g5139 [Metschnikowia sp. JCM 33374]
MPDLMHISADSAQAPHISQEIGKITFISDIRDDSAIVKPGPILSDILLCFSSSLSILFFSSIPSFRIRSPPMCEHVVIERPLGAGENFFRCRTELGFYYNFASVAAYSRDLTQDVSLLYRALRKSVLDYHLLVCNVFQDTAKGIQVVRPVDVVTLGDVVRFEPWSFSPSNTPVPEKCLHDLCRESLFNFNVEKPLFKMFVYGTHDVGASFEHTLFDGVVAMYFQEILLENLAFCDDASNNSAYLDMYGAVPENIDSSTIVFDYNADKQYLRNSLPPPLEMVMQDPSVDYSDNDPHHYSKHPPAGFPEKWPGRFPATKDMTVAFKSFNIPPHQFGQILKKCKENKVTFTSYLNCIQALALNPIYGDKHHSSSVVAITLRRFLSPNKVPPEYRNILTKDGYRILGMYANMGVPEFIAPLKHFSWDYVREIHANSAQSVKNDKLLNMRKQWYDEASVIGDNRGFFDPAIGKNKADSVKISNLGLARFPIYEVGSNKQPWTIHDIVFAQDLAPNASEFVFNLVSSPKGGLNVVMSYFDHRFDDSEHENFDMYPNIVKNMILEHAGVDVQS